MAEIEINFDKMVGDMANIYVHFHRNLRLKY
jgi:hypothetical protein